ncbi:MAG: T9SS type A sorting domain-containing protein, partial [Bacteroidota bacterium]
DGLTGAEVGMNASDLEGCFDLSNPITVNRLEGMTDGGTISTTDPTEICAGDGVGDPIDVTLDGNVGANSAWVITDADANILALPAAPPFDLDGAGPGVCLIWHLSFEDGLVGAEVGNNANDLEGCFDLSNPITVTRNGVDGGDLMLADGGDELTICAGDGEPDPFDVALEGNLGSNSAWVITDADANILALPAAPPFDFEGAGPGICLVWHLSFEDGLTGAEVGMNASDLEGCFDLSNPITVTRDTSGAACVTSTEDLNESIVEISMFPNPTQNTLNVLVELEQKEDVQFTILNLGGQIIQSIRRNDFIQDQIEFDVSNFSNGIYILNIQTDKAAQNIRFSKID